jgi:hypothetical protein
LYIATQTPGKGKLSMIEMQNNPRKYRVFSQKTTTDNRLNQEEQMNSLEQSEIRFETLHLNKKILKHEWCAHCVINGLNQCCMGGRDKYFIWAQPERKASFLINICL